MENTIRLRITTQSNLFIGGAPVPFEIGGIDLQTIVDPEGFPYIPGSTLKGVLRAIIREDESKTAKDIAQRYAVYLKEEKETNWERIQEYTRNLSDTKEALTRIEKRYNEATEEKKLSQEYLFGIKGFNNTPKLFFSDLLLSKESRCEKKPLFSIDMKNSIDDKDGVLFSNPRMYRTARAGLVFEGEIRLHKMELLGEGALELCKRYLLDNLLKFNDGIYRLGNSKSRGYGKVKVEVVGVNQSEVPKV